MIDTTRRNKIRKIIFTTILLLLVICVLSAVVCFVNYKSFTKGKIEGIQHPVKYVVPAGSSLSSLATRLENDGLISNRWYFIAMSRLDGSASNIKAGEYDILPGMTPVDLLKMFVEGKVVQHSFTIIEGWTFKQMLEAIQKNNKLIHDTIGLSDEQIMKKIGYSGLHPEGRFYPDTYYFPLGTKDSQFLKRAYETMQQKLNGMWEANSKKCPLKSPYEALIMASIVEKETAVPSERDEIAGVFCRRLKKRMRLQTDPTVIYGMGESYTGNIKSKHLREKTAYNTYVIKGLPPTPIALPGHGAIYATLHPKDGNFLYFVAKGDGTHHFSSSFKEHDRAVTRYQRKRK